MIAQTATYTLPPLSVLVTWGVGVVVGNWTISALIFNAVAERQFIRYFDSCQDRIMSRLNVWQKERWDMLDAHDDSIRAFDSITERMDSHHRSQTDAWREMTSALKAVQLEAKQTAIVVARIEGRLDEWKGDERRKMQRRAMDQHDED